MTSSLCCSCDEISRLFRTLGVIEVIHFREVDSFSLYTSHSLEQNALAGCNLCRLFCSQFSETEVLEMRKQDLEDRWIQGYERHFQTRFYFKQRRFLRSLFMERRFGDQEVRTKEIHLIPVSEAKMFETDMLVDLNTTSYKSLDLAKIWLEECRGEHTKCSPLWKRPSPLPSRLLYLSPDLSSPIQLTDSCPQGSTYASLSHVWGGTVPIRLLSSNYSSLKCEIPWTDLPQTFRDAISVSRSLNIRYLWIDSLCIIQDSKEDWLKESARMGEVYANAVVNIAATSSSNSFGGLCLQRTLGLPEPFNIELQAKDGRNTSYKALSPKVWDREVEGAPLNHRAWVCQERLLSPRMIHFTRNQIYWECCEKVACELYQKGFNASEIMGYDTTPKKLGLAQSPQGTDGTNIDSRFEEFYPVWRAILDTYDRQNLTFTTDKLIAISGLAHQWQQQLGVEAEYIAGLWKPMLPQHLLWLAGNQNFHRVTRQEIYRAPTWSWASVDGDFTPRHYIYSKHDERDYVKIKEVNIDLLSIDDPFGGVSSASIVLSTRLARVTVRIDAGRAREDLSLCIEDIVNMDIRGRKDCNTREDPWTARAVGVYPDLYLLPILLGDHNPWEGLFIEKAKDERIAFERWGTWQIWHEKTKSVEMVLGEAFARFDAHAEENGFESFGKDENGKTLYDITLV